MPEHLRGQGFRLASSGMLTTQALGAALTGSLAEVAGPAAAMAGAAWRNEREKGGAMSIVVLPELDESLRESQSLLIEIRSNDDRLASAMTMLRQAVVRLEGQGHNGEIECPAFVSQPIPLPGRQLLHVDFGSLPDEPVLSFPRLLSQQLCDSGVQDAVVGVARPSGQIEKAEKFRLVARAYLRGPLGVISREASSAPPLPLLDVAVRWLHSERRLDDELSGFVIGVEVPLTIRSLWTVPAAILSTPPQAAQVSLVSSDFASRLAAGSIVGSYGNAVPVASLTSAGQGWTAREVAERMRRLRDLIRTHAGVVVWAGVDATVDSRSAFFARYEQPACVDGMPVLRRPEVDLLADVLVPDAMWYQVLSAGHLERLGGLPAGALPLAGGRAELTIGEPEQWMPGHPDGDAVRARGRESLAGCLVSEQVAHQMTVARMRQSRRSV